MAKEKVVTQENFELLLTWLDRNRDAAALSYEKIRGRLIRIFIGRGCFEAEELADETFNRVITKISQIADTYTGEPLPYFYGVANKIHYEWLRKQKKLNHLPPPEAAVSAATADREFEFDCLEECLDKLPAAERRIIVGYYSEEKTARIENRRQICENLGISPNALQVKAHRLRLQLKNCLQNCLAQKSVE